MFYHWIYPLHEYYSFLNVFHYISFRAAMASVTALLLMMTLGPAFIQALAKFQCLENIKNVHQGLYDKHKCKGRTPTMGGSMILSSILIAVLLWADLSNFYIQMVLLTIVWLGGLGFADDYHKCKSSKRKGLSAKVKFFWQFMFTVVIGSMIFAHDSQHLSLTFPFFKELTWDLGWFYIVFMFFVIIGSCNAVNITDGLDGLATGTLLLSFTTYAILAYVTGHYGLSGYLQVLYLPGAGELTILCMAAIGACLGFLWFNSHPASVFMGDMGSLALGGLLGVVAVLVKQELLLAIVGGVFVIETLSVMIQVAYFKLTRKRFFLIAPLHHHFEMKGMPETKIVIRFWIIAAICAIVALSTLKIR